MVECVEELPAQLHAPPLLDGDVFEQSHVPVKQTRTGEGSLTNVSNRSCSRLTEGSGINIVHARRGLASDATQWISTEVDAPVLIETGLRNILTRENRKREPGLRGNDAGKLPVAEHAVKEFI